MKHIKERLKHIRVIRSAIYGLIGTITYPGLVWFNRLKIEGMEHLKDLPSNNVLFVSNHQTYFTDVITFIHVFCAAKWRKKNKLGIPFYLLRPFTNLYFVAAEETMNSTFVSRFFKLAGAITVKRTWRAEGTEVRRGLDPSDTRKITEALEKSWVITFPQGTTKPFAPGRKGTAHIIKTCKPIVIPVVINGFWRAFSKRGLTLKKRGSLLKVRFKEPMIINYDAPVDEILEEVMQAIEQSKDHMLKGKHHLAYYINKQQELLNNETLG